MARMHSWPYFLRLRNWIGEGILVHRDSLVRNRNDCSRFSKLQDWFILGHFREMFLPDGGRHTEDPHNFWRFIRRNGGGRNGGEIEGVSTFQFRFLELSGLHEFEYSLEDMFAPSVIILELDERVIRRMNRDGKSLAMLAKIVIRAVRMKTLPRGLAQNLKGIERG